MHTELAIKAKLIQELEQRLAEFATSQTRQDEEISLKENFTQSRSQLSALETSNSLLDGKVSKLQAEKRTMGEEISSLRDDLKECYKEKKCLEDELNTANISVLLGEHYSDSKFGAEPAHGRFESQLEEMVGQERAAQVKLSEMTEKERTTQTKLIDMSDRITSLTADLSDATKIEEKSQYNLTELERKLSKTQYILHKNEGAFQMFKTCINQIRNRTMIHTSLLPYPIDFPAMSNEKY
ncbi:hypothetical protein GQ44DRAFT_769469 [Phaeosphaeriaceae sp. PMI808]|nr:hypothetical protein GQ44DRAFT_769469 [Phaeosphaeriaceae sp. PMI808]